MPTVGAVGIRSENSRLVLVEGDVVVPGVDTRGLSSLAHVLDVLEGHGRPGAPEFARRDLVKEVRDKLPHQLLLVALPERVNRAHLDEVALKCGLLLQIRRKL